MINLFKKFSSKKILFENFPRISFEETMLKYGTDKPDLRNPLEIYEITEIFNREDVKFEIFKKLIKSGASLLEFNKQKIPRINLEVFLIILINGQRNRRLLDWRILL